MVWKNSELIGFGMQKNSNGKYYYDINYYPTGNIDGQFKKNVFPAGTNIYDPSSNRKYENNDKEFIKEDKDNNVKKEYKKKNYFQMMSQKIKKIIMRINLILK